ncbi:TPA: IS200/IS605 family transposase, partial [Streptococcus suis]
MLKTCKRFSENYFTLTIVFTPKYRRKSIYYKIRQNFIDIFHHLCRYKGVEIIEGHMMPDHVHMLVLIPPKL